MTHDICNDPHPNNNNPYNAVYFTLGGSMSTEMPGMFCQREKGHEGRHSCFIEWTAIKGMGEQHEWGGDLDSSSPAPSGATP